MCIPLAAGGCEAIVEGFYSVVSAHKKSGGQSNNVLVQRAIIDWTIPDPISCPNTMKEIARLYTDGSKKLGIAKHRLPVFFYEHQQAAAKHHVSKVVDRLKSVTPRCPHIIQADVFEDINWLRNLLHIRDKLKGFKHYLFILIFLWNIIKSVRGLVCRKVFNIMFFQ